MGKRTNWKKKIKKLFGSESFTLEELCEKEKISAPIWKMRAGFKKAKYITQNKDGTYRLADTSGASNNKGKGKGRRATEYLVEMSKKFGDSAFKLGALVDATGANQSTVSTAVSVLVKDGLVKKLNRGIYSITDEGHNCVAAVARKSESTKGVDGVDSGPMKQVALGDRRKSSILKKLEDILDEGTLAKWVYKTIMNDEDLAKHKETIVAKAALSNKFCRGILERAAERKLAELFK